MSNKIISILGCGWLGKPLGSQLASAGYIVRGSTTRPEKVLTLQETGITPFILRVGESLMDDNTLTFFNTDILVISLPHGVKAGKADEYITKIQSVTQAAQRGNVKGIILLSTTSVYPNLNRFVTEEDADPQNPITQAEGVVRNSGIFNTIVRFAGLIGPGRHPGKFLAGKQDVSGGSMPVNLIHVDDCIAIIMRIIQLDIWNEVMNACADDHPPKKVFYTRAAHELGLQPPSFSKDTEAPYKIISNAHLKKVLDYNFIHGLM